MKKLTILIDILTLMAGMFVVSCQREDLIVDTPEDNVSGIIVTVNAGIASDPGTKSEVAVENGKRVLKFTEGDKLYVYREISSSLALAGMLDMEGSPSADGKKADFTGTIKAYDNYLLETSYEFGPDPLVGTYATLVHKDRNAQAIYITVGSGPVLDFSKMSGADVETVMTSSLYVQGGYDNLTKSYTLTSYNPIFNCSFSGLAASTEYTLRTECEDDSQNIFISDPRKFTTDANGNGRLAFISYDSGNRKWKMVIKNSDETATIGEFGLGGDKTNITKKVYNVSRFWNGSAFCVITDLANITTNYTAQNGEVLTGTLGSNVKISIANNATVILHNVDINSGESFVSNHAGIECLGNANIILSGTNVVKSFKYDAAGIQAGGNGTTLTISGDGSLTVCSAYKYSGRYGAGIGGPVYGNCGDIIINGGTIIATSTFRSAAIGGGAWGNCGSITINGGNITANGGNWAGAIGAGQGEPGIEAQIIDDPEHPEYPGMPEMPAEPATCGVITITGGTVNANGGEYGAAIGTGEVGGCDGVIISGGTITATKGSGAVHSIGFGSMTGTLYTPIDFTITIDGVNVGYISTSPFTYPGP